MSTSVSWLGFSLDQRAKAPVIWAALLAGAALAWTVTVRGAMEMGNGPGTMGRGLAGFMLLWIVMMAAMMLPSVAPVGSLYLRSVRSRSTGALRAPPRRERHPRLPGGVDRLRHGRLRPRLGGRVARD